jgi:hypothetical protein
MTLLVTDRRLLVLDGKNLVGQLAAPAVAGAEVVKRRRFADWTVALELAGGDRVHLEVSRAYQPERLVAALTSLASHGR